jgi:hypothetical protein
MNIHNVPYIPHKKINDGFIHKLAVSAVFNVHEEIVKKARDFAGQ